MSIFQQEIQLQYALDVVDRCVNAYKNPRLSNDQRGFALWLARDILRNKKIDWSITEINSIINAIVPEFLKIYAKNLLKDEFEKSAFNEVKNENPAECYIYNSISSDS